MHVSVPTCRPSRSHTAHRLDLEWSRLRRSRSAIRHAAGWQIVEAPLGDLDQVLTAIGHCVPWTAENEAAMRRLVLLAPHDELAARVVVQRLLPGLLAVVRRRRGQAEQVLDELLGALWIGVRTFNPSRRPGCIAASLIADADYRAFRLAWRRASSTERPTGLRPEDEMLAQPVESARQIVAGLLAEAEQVGVPVDDIVLIRRLLDEVPTVELARQLDVTPRTVRNRRDRITDRLREVALAA